MRKSILPILLAACFMLTGCFDIQGVHVLHYYGESDTGSYRIKMSRLTYSLLDQDKSSDMLKDLRKWSRPLTRAEGDDVYLEDNSGKASMEHFYDNFNCSTSAQPGNMDCRFAFKVPKELADLANWSIDWEVVLQPDMRVLASNHQRTRREDGRDRLIWFFDGNHVSAASVDFTVRIPKAQ